jgi:RHS repeat-associated protein
LNCNPIRPFRGPKQRHGTGNYIAYGYTYDYLDRIELAYLHGKSPGWSSFSTNTPNRRVTVEYADGRGNIENIERYNDGYTRIDDISYSYEAGTNKIDTLTDGGNSVGFDERSGGSYDYDKNGNLTDDPYKDLLIAYNHLNLPDTVTPGTGSDKLVFFYTAGGSKLRKKLIETGGNTIQDYIGGIEYTNSTVDAIYHAEGRAVKDGSIWDHEYVITDHLGNTRVRFHDDNGNGTISSGELLSTHDYYPFGMEWNAGSYQYTYNGKERNDELGLDLFDYGARMYDPAIARWNAVDPLAAYNGSESPYAYVGNNPVSYIDPNGGFRIPAAFRSKYPNLVNYIENQLQSHIENSAAISGALFYFSGGNLNPEQIAADFKVDSGPILKETNSFADGYYDHPTSSTPIASIAIGNSKLEKIENILRSGSDQAKQIALIDFMRTFVNEYTHYGDALDGYDLIQIPYFPFVGNDYSGDGLEPSRPNKFEEGNAAARFLYPSVDPVTNFYLFSQGIWSPGNSDEESKSKKDESKVPDPPRA